MTRPATSRSFWNAVGWAYAMTWGQRVVQLGVTLLMAQILGPSNFGTFAIASVYVLFLQIFLDRGVSTAVIQRKDLEPDHLDAAFWLMLAISTALVAVSVGLSSWWAALNDDPGLAAIIGVLSISLPVQALCSIQRAVLQRSMNYRALAGFTVVASLVGGAAGLLAAWRGMGVWALVAQQIGTAAALALMLWIASDWRPRFRIPREPARELLQFSSGVYATAAGGFIHRRSDIALIGLFLGPVAAGVYHLAERLVGNLSEAVTKSLTVAALPHFSKLQAAPDELKAAYLQCIRASTLVTLPAMAGLAVVSAPFIALLGEEWQGTATVISILCILGAVRAGSLFTGPMLYATGRPGTMARLTWFLAAVNVPVLAATGYWLRGADLATQTCGIAIVRAAVFALIYAPINLRTAMRACDVSLGEVTGKIAVPAAAAGCVLAVGFAARALSSHLELGAVASLAAVGAIAGTAGLAVLAAGDAEVRTRITDLVKSSSERRLSSAKGPDD